MNNIIKCIIILWCYNIIYNYKSIFILKMSDLTIYNEKQYLILKENIPLIEKEAKIKRLELLEPDKKERQQIKKVILEYIQENKKIIYGGENLNMLLIAKDKKEAIYDESDISDIEFYSTNPIVDLINLCDILHNLNFKYVVGKEAQHHETYTIIVNYEKYADITYMSQNLYDKMSTVTIDNLILASPEFITIDYFRQINDPITSYWRLSKFAERYYKLQKLYPFKYDFNKNTPNMSDIGVGNNKQKEEVKKYIDMIFKFLLNKKSAMVMGFYAYEYYVNKGKIPNIKDIPYLEIISTNYHRDIFNIMELIDITHKDSKLNVIEYYPFFQFTGRHATIYYEDVPIIYIYHSNHKCIQNHGENIKEYKKKINIVSYTTLAMYIMISREYSLINNKENMVNIHKYMLYNLYKQRNKYLSDNNKDILDNTIYKEYDISCYGNTIDPPRLFREKIEKRKAARKPYVFQYDPKNKKNVDLNYKFANTTGTRINKEANIQISLEKYKDYIKSHQKNKDSDNIDASIDIDTDTE